MKHGLHVWYEPDVEERVADHLFRIGRAVIYNGKSAV